MLEWRATIDRIADGMAVLVPGDRPETRFTIRIDLLPAGIRDGSMLVFCIERDDMGTAKDAQQIADLQRELAGKTSAVDESQ